MTDIINKADKYAEWIVNNPDKKGTDEFNTVAQAYKEAKSQNVSAPNGNDYVPSAANIEKPVTVNQPERSLTNKALDFLAQKATLGGAKTWDQNLFADGSVIPKNANEPTTWEYTKALGEKALENSNALAGIGPIGQIAPMSTKAGMTVSNAISSIPTVAAETFPNAAKMASKVGAVVKDSPANILSFFSGKDPEAFKVAYNIAKEGKGAIKDQLKNEYEAGIELQKKLGSQMNYNYARALGLPHDIAQKAVHYRQDVENGAWKLWNDYVAAHPDIPPAYIPFQGASNVEKLKLAQQAGVDLGRWSPVPPKTGMPLTAGDVYDMGKWLLGTPSTILKSPRIAGLFATTAGKAVGAGANAAQYIPPILQASKNSLSGPQLTSLLGLLGNNNE
jgi:hypothetical protein